MRTPWLTNVWMPRLLPPFAAACLGELVIMTPCCPALRAPAAEVAAAGPASALDSCMGIVVQKYGRLITFHMQCDIGLACKHNKLDILQQHEGLPGPCISAL